MVKLHFVPFQSIKRLLKVYKMGFSFPTFYEYIVYVDFHIPPYLLVEHLFHQCLIGGTSILQPERREFVAI